MARQWLRHKPSSLLTQQYNVWFAKIMSQINLPSFLSVRRLQTALPHSFFESNQDLFFFFFLESLLPGTNAKDFALLLSCD